MCIRACYCHGHWCGCHYYYNPCCCHHHVTWIGGYVAPTTTIQPTTVVQLPVGSQEVDITIKNKSLSKKKSKRW